VQAAALSVLTLEDDPIVRADLRLVLEEAGFDVVADAGDDVEAVELAREHRPDVVVLRNRGETSDRILEERQIPIVEVARPFSSSQVVDAVTGALAAHRERETRATSLQSIESLVENLSFATPTPTELEEASWERGHVWRRSSSGEGGTDDPERR
jgi:chemotaxis response regulator CheB